MKTKQRLLFPALGIVAAVLIAPNCSAQCLGGFHSKATHTSLFLQPGQAQLAPAFFADENDRDHDRDDRLIVGFWSQKLISEGSNGIKDGTMLDNGLTQWHSDHTEIDNNGSRPPNTGNFCLGVWKRVGERTYKLNHFPLVWDPTGTVFIGPANFRTEVTVSADGQHYRGHFTLDQYDPTGKTFLGRVQGIVTGTRITVDSKTEDFF